jgi:hypothetical protein
MNTSVKSSTRNRLIRRYLPIATVAAMAALMVVPSSGMAFRFGSELTGETQPSNAGDGHECAPNPGVCTWAMGEAYGRPDGGERSPFTGTLRRIRLIAQVPGTFRLQIVKITPDGEGKAIRNGRIVNYQGQPENADPEDPYVIESFKVKMPIKKGQRLGIRTSNNSLVRCSSGGPNSLLWQPPLVPGALFSTPDADDGCWLLLEAIGKRKHRR